MAPSNERLRKYNFKSLSILEKARFISVYGKLSGRTSKREADTLYDLQHEVTEKHLDNFVRFSGPFFMVANFGDESAHGGTSPSIDNRAEALAKIIIAHSQPDIVGYVVRGVVKPDNLEKSRSGMTASISSIARKIEEVSTEVKSHRVAAFPDTQLITATNGLSEYSIDGLIDIANDYAAIKVKVGIIAVTAPTNAAKTNSVDIVAKLTFDSQGNENWNNIT